MDFVELKVVVAPDFADIIVAELAEIGYESFVETPQGVDAYVNAAQFDETSVQEILRKYRPLTEIAYTVTAIERRNWNEEWEKSYQPIFIGNQCVVRASFHALLGSYPYDIVINPKMSFGTGHHDTTSLMLQSQLSLDHSGKKVMDAGCGTGILAIMACKRGAAEVVAFDIDEWAVENTRENILLNDCASIRVQRGTIADVHLAVPFDIILANINRNILLQEMNRYAAALVVGGTLLLSGFYERDITELEKAAARFGLQTQSTSTQNTWAVIRLEKKN